MACNLIRFQSVVISGAKSSEEAAFPKEAVKAYHDKPMPTHDKASAAHSKPKIIQQPKKWAIKKYRVKKDGNCNEYIICNTEKLNFMSIIY